MLERCLSARAKRNAGFDLTEGPLQIPVAAQRLVTGQVIGGGNVRTGEIGKAHCRIAAAIAFAEIAAVHENVGGGGEMLADVDELLCVLIPHGVGIKHRDAQLQCASAAMGNDMDRIHALAVRQVLGDLLDAVARSIEQNHGGARIDVGQQRLVVLNRRIDKYDFDARGRECATDHVDRGIGRSQRVVCGHA